MSRVVLVTGGVRSGKSRFAEQLVSSFGGTVTYLATSVAVDDEMEVRIAKHQAQRPSEWRTFESPTDLTVALGSAQNVLVECLGIWSANHLIELGSDEEAGWWDRVFELEARLAESLALFLAGMRRNDQNVVLVTNEVGYGVHPPTTLGRAFQDLLGRLNQTAAGLADDVFLVVTGLPINVKQLADLSSSVQGLHYENTPTNS